MTAKRHSINGREHGREDDINIFADLSRLCLVWYQYTYIGPRGHYLGGTTVSHVQLKTRAEEQQTHQQASKTAAENTSML